VSLQGLNSS